MSLPSGLIFFLDFTTSTNGAGLPRLGWPSDERSLYGGGVVGQQNGELYIIVEVGRLGPAGKESDKTHCDLGDETSRSQLESNHLVRLNGHRNADTSPVKVVMCFARYSAGDPKTVFKLKKVTGL